MGNLPELRHMVCARTVDVGFIEPFKARNPQQTANKKPRELLLGFGGPSHHHHHAHLKATFKHENSKPKHESLESPITFLTCLELIIRIKLFIFLLIFPLNPVGKYLDSVCGCGAALTPACPPSS